MRNSANQIQKSTNEIHQPTNQTLKSKVQICKSTIKHKLDTAIYLECEEFFHYSKRHNFGTFWHAHLQVIVTI